MSHAAPIGLNAIHAIGFTSQRPNITRKAELDELVAAVECHIAVHIEGPFPVPKDPEPGFSSPAQSPGKAVARRPNWKTPSPLLYRPTADCRSGPDTRSIVKHADAHHSVARPVSDHRLPSRR
jgi:hypothetical protein